MNPSMQLLIVKGGTQDQPTDQGVSKSIKKLSKGKQNSANLLDVIGGAGSFASIIKQKETVLSIKKGDQKKEGIGLTGLTAIEDEIKGGLTGLKGGRGSLSRKVAKEGNSEKIAFGDQTPLGKKVNLNPEVVSSEETSEAKVKGEKLLGKIGKSQFPGGKGSIDGGDVLNLPDEFLTRDGDNPHIKSMMEIENTLSLKQGSSGFDNEDTSRSRDTIPLDGEKGRRGVALSGSGLKSNNLAKKNISEGMGVPRAGDAIEAHHGDSEQDILKELNIKEISIKKVSSDPKEQKTVLKDDQLKQEDVKENPTSTKQVNTLSEKTEGLNDIFSNGFNEKRSFERGMNEPLAAKTDTSLWMTNADFNGVKNIWNGSGANINGDSAPLQFQEIIGQIKDDAANMLKKGSGRIVITLDPPNLGTLNMDVRVHNDTVRMVLIADNHEVKQVLNSNLDQLKTSLQDQGLTMDRFDVLVQQKSSENPGFHQWGGALFEQGQGRRENTKEDNTPQQALPVGGDEPNESHLGIISLFA